MKTAPDDPTVRGEACSRSLLSLVAWGDTSYDSALKDALKAGDLTPTEETGATAWLDADNKRLMALAEQRKDIEAKIQAADAQTELPG